MHVHIVHFSALTESFTKRIAVRLEELYAANGDTVTRRDLAAPAFNPVLTGEEILMAGRKEYKEDVFAEQALVDPADRLIFVYPLYQLAMPAVMKGYVERVLCFNFAYGRGPNGTLPLMEGKRGAVYSPMGAPLETMQKNGHIDAMNHITLSIFGMRGIEIDHIQYFDMNERETQLAELAV